MVTDGIDSGGAGLGGRRASGSGSIRSCLIWIPSSMQSWRDDQAHLPRTLRTHEVEGRVEFGTLSVGRESLSKGTAMVPWPMVERVELKDGRLCVRRRDGRRPVVVIARGKVPNAWVDQVLVDRILEAASGPGG
jgi:hypothetical protein